MMTPMAMASNNNCEDRDRDAVFGSLSTASTSSTSKVDDRWPPGFRFHPTDEELVLYYLKRKICRRHIKLNIIGDLDVYKYEPWELPGMSPLQTGDKQWYFFSPRDRKYPNGVRSNRGTKCGYWKATGKDRSIAWNSHAVGQKKTLVFYNGRAPKGERTDWVMHEYTIDKEEIKNCSTVQDSYALYKIYKKSGPGPKNGEEYGAPFLEEEWLDDDHCDDRLGIVSGENQTTQQELPDVSYQEFSTAGLEDVLRQVADDSEVSQEHLKKVECEKGLRSSTKGELPGEAISTETCKVWQPRDQLVDAETTFDIARSMNSLLPYPIVPEVTPNPQGTDGDFVELNDLTDQESNVPSFNINDKLLSGKEGLYDLDFYYDASMFLPEEIFPLEGIASQSYFDCFSGDMDGLSDYNLSSSFYDESSYHLAQFTSQLWTHDDKFSVHSQTESSQVLLAPSASGALPGDTPVNVVEGAQMQHSSSKGDSDHWITSAVNSLLESIPTNPASASENSLISKTFERMSSFGTLSMRTKERDAAAVVGGREGGNNCFLFISCLGALWAIVWVLIIGSMVKIFKSFCSRLVAT